MSVISEEDYIIIKEEICAAFNRAFSQCDCHKCGNQITSDHRFEMVKFECDYGGKPAYILRHIDCDNPHSRYSPSLEFNRLGDAAPYKAASAGQTFAGEKARAVLKGDDGRGGQ